MTTLDLTRTLVQNVESHLLGIESPNRIKRYFFYPFYYLKKGAYLTFKPVFIFWFVLAIFYIFIHIFFLNNLILPVISYIALFPILLNIISVPSSYSFCNISNNNVLFVKEELVNCTLNDLEHIATNINNSKSHVSSRLSYFKWFIGCIWTVSTLLFTIQLTIDLASKSKIELVSNNLAFSLAILILISLITLFITQCYSKMSDSLYTCIHYGIVEKKRELSAQ